MYPTPCLGGGCGEGDYKVRLSGLRLCLFRMGTYPSPRRVRTEDVREAVSATSGRRGILKYNGDCIPIRVPRYSRRFRVTDKPELKR